MKHVFRDWYLRWIAIDRAGRRKDEVAHTVFDGGFDQRP
jgi:hypothetical protein